MATTTTDRRQGVNSSAAVKVPCKIATTANITLSGTQTIDGTALAAEDRVLVKNQTDGTENGIYDVKTIAWTRSPDWSGTLDVKKGTSVRVTNGTANQGEWYVDTENPVVPGTTSTSFAFGNKYQITGVINIKTFGAIGDDSTDDTAAIQAAYTQATADGAGEVFWPDGTYVYSTLNISSNIESVGESKGGTIAKRISTYTTDGIADENRLQGMFNAWIADDLTGGFENIGFRNMTIDGNKANLTVTDGTKLATISASTLEMKLVDGLHINNCIIKNGLKNGVYTTGCDNVEIESSTIKDNGTTDFPAVGMSRNGIGLRGSWYNETTTTNIEEDHTGFRVHDCEISGTADEGIQYAFAKDITITENHIHDNLDKAIEGDTGFPGGDLSDIIITGNNIHDNTDTAISVGNSPTVQNLIISDNIIRECGNSAIFVDLTTFASDGGKLVIANNIIDNVGTITAASSSTHAIYANGYDVDIHDNILTDSNFNGITVQKFKSLTVHDNTVKAIVAGINYKGISVPVANGSAGADNLSIYENTIKGFSGASSAAIKIAPVAAETIESVNISNNRAWDMRQFIDIGDANLTITSIDVIKNYANSGIDTFNDFLDVTGSTITKMYCLGNNPSDVVNQLINDKSVITTLVQSDNGKSPETLDIGRTAVPSGGSHKEGEKVWKTNPVVAGSTGSEYIIIGWIYSSTAWVEMRMLTGT